MIYLDYAATTPMSAESLEVFNHVNQHYFGNSSSLHDIGTSSQQLLETCRSEMAAMINGKKEGIYFTSGGSESNYLAIRSLLDGNREKGNHIITTRTEHSSIHHLIGQLEDAGYQVTFLEVDHNGLISLQQLKEEIREETCLVSIHHANSETGIIQPLEAVGKILQEKNILFHSDTVQTFGKIPIDVEKLRLSSLSISSHKIYGPKGVGALYIDPYLSWKSQYAGASHERGMRPGTVNVPGIAAFTAAAQTLHANMKTIREKHDRLRVAFFEKLKQHWLPIHIEAEQANTLPHIIGLRLKGLEGQYVMLECNRRQIAISTGSACQVGSQEPSRTMLATGKSAEEAREFIRISFGKDTSLKELDIAVTAFKEIVEETYG
ncbi:IscS subfamily cysteine desulfurase [Bacillus tianshenii]|uniref:IscS subfamily cysteine desulfurase n=1 Tax=Sutcliffiella tianshenii TaxID=1463404 RepID=UPI001CD3B04C|nr:IscS subfamily cysteine desulfurase [Bacillus tianshenii]MCA1318772.1 IscS subfamily cysteine desulfurase [Bacillus tianshenii]